MKNFKIAVTLILFTFIIFILNSCKSTTTTVGKEKESKNSPSNLSDEALIPKLKKHTNTRYLSESDHRVLHDEEKWRKFEFNSIDLNNDGKNEYFIKFRGMYFCGNAGCTTLLLSHDFEEISRFTLIKTLYASSRYENGWKILMIKYGDDWKKLIYKDGTYPSNHSLIDQSNLDTDENPEIIFEHNYDETKMVTF